MNENKLMSIEDKLSTIANKHYNRIRRYKAELKASRLKELKKLHILVLKIKEQRLMKGKNLPLKGYQKRQMPL
jgi:hypothetical protein